MLNKPFVRVYYIEFPIIIRGFPHEIRIFCLLLAGKGPALNLVGQEGVLDMLPISSLMVSSLFLCDLSSDAAKGQYNSAQGGHHRGIGRAIFFPL